MDNFVCSVWSPAIAFILAAAYIICLVRDYLKGKFNMKTWEIMQYSGKNFERKLDGLIMEIAEDGTLNWASGCTFINIHDEWEEVKEPVTWEEAFKAGLEGKKIKPEGQHLTYTDYEELYYALAYLGERPGYYQNLMLGKWYIE